MRCIIEGFQSAPFLYVCLHLKRSSNFMRCERKSASLLAVYETSCRPCVMGNGWFMAPVLHGNTAVSCSAGCQYGRRPWRGCCRLKPPLREHATMLRHPGLAPPLMALPRAWESCWLRPRSSWQPSRFVPLRSTWNRPVPAAFCNLR